MTLGLVLFFSVKAMQLNEDSAVAASSSRSSGLG